MYDYKLFLRLSGFKWLIDTKEPIKNKNTIVIDIEKDGNVNLNQRDSIGSCFDNIYVKNTINFFHFLIIISFIIWPCIATIITSDRKDDIKIITSNTFSFLVLIQYILGCIYFRCSHFMKIIQLSNNSDNLLKKSFYSALIISFLLAILSIILLGMDYKINIYSDLYKDVDNGGKVGVMMLLFVEKFYSYYIFSINTIIFAVVMIVQSAEVDNFYELLKGKIENGEIFDISTVMNEYLRIKNNHGEIVDKLNSIFSSLTSIGIVNAYFVVVNFRTEYIGALQYINSAWVILIEIVYIYVMIQVKESVEDIIKLLDSPRFVELYFRQYNMDDFELFDSSNKGIRNTDMKSIKLDNLNIINNNRKSFTSSFSKDIFKSSLNTKTIYNKIKHVNKNQQNSFDYIAKDMNMLKEITLRAMIICQENSAVSYWNAIETKLKDPFKSFSILGYDMDDTTLLQQGFTLIVGFILTTNAIESIGF